MITFIGVLIALVFIMPFLIWGWLNFLGDKINQLSWGKWKIIGTSMLIGFVLIIILISIMILIIP